MKFKVGDKIRGISDNFKITNKAMTLAEVMSVEPLGIRVKILEHTNKSQIGKICLAITLKDHLAHFELVEEKEMNKIDELEMKVKELSEEIEQLKAEEDNGVWKPKNGEPYVYLSTHGFTRFDEWRDSYPQILTYNIGNVFKTQEEAEFRAEQLKVEAELRRFARPFIECKHNFILTYNYLRDEIFIESSVYTQYTNIHFASEEIAQKAIETVGEERIKKYYFGVED